MTLPFLTVAWLVGIVVANAAQAPWWVWLILTPPAIVGAVLVPPRSGHLSWRLVFACGAAFALGAARLGLATPVLGEGDLATYNDRGFVTVEGLIIDAPDLRDTHINLRVRAEKLWLSDGALPMPVRGVMLVQAPRVGEYRYGDPVRVLGELHTPPEYEDFSYRDYLARQGVYSIMQYSQVTVTGPRRGNPIRAALLDFRVTAHQAIIRLLPDPQASLLAGILLGIESGIDPEVRDAFNAVGASHVIAISGSNLAILGGLILSLTRRVMPERWAAVVTIIGILVYAAFVGGDAPVVRAAIMVTLGLVAAQLGRETWAFASMAFAALLMTAINPFTLWDVGFQLSFLATLGLVLYVEPLQKWIEKGLSALISAERARQIVAALSDAFVVTVAAQLTTTPLIAYTFGRFSLLSLPVNFLIIPAQTPLMVLGGLGVLTALVIWPLGQVISWASWVFLSYTLWVVRGFAALPFASLEVKDIPAVWVSGIYAVLFGFTFVLTRRPEDAPQAWRARLSQAFSTKLVGFIGLVLAALLLIAAWSLPDGKLHVTFIDVGDGTATLVETPSGRHILVDAGGSARRLSAALGDELPFWKRRLDLVVLSRSTRAHTAALLPVLERYRVDVVISNGLHGDTDYDRELWATLAELGTREVVAQPGMRIAVGDGVLLTVLHARADQASEQSDDPDEPLALLLHYDDARFLLTGDLTERDEAALLAGDWPLDATVLQVPAHGDRSVSSEAFLQAVGPQINVLPVGANNRFGLPHPETLERLAALDVPLYRLDQTGTIRISTDGRLLWIVTQR